MLKSDATFSLVVLLFYNVMDNIISVLRESTENLFSDKWYNSTALKIFESKESKEGYVYFMKFSHSNLIKIGRTTTLTKRLNAHRSNSNSNVFLIGFVYQSQFDKLERDSHNNFSEFRQSGEWFDIDDQMAMNYINCKGGTIVNSYIEQTTSIKNGKVLRLDKRLVFKNEVPSPFYDAMGDFFNTLPTGIRIDKNDIFSDAIKIHEKYSTMKNKTVTIALKKHLTHEGVDFEEGKSGDLRYIIIKN